MVERQLRAGGIHDERVLAAMGTVPREEFVPDRLRGDAYADGALPIGHGQTISQPWVVAAICASLELRGGERVLEVGGGSGYSTAVIAELVRPGGAVRSFELVPELAISARETLGRLGYGETEILAGDGTGATDETWDAVAIHAAAPEVPTTLIRRPAIRRAHGPSTRTRERGHADRVQEDRRRFCARGDAREPRDRENALCPAARRIRLSDTRQVGSARRDRTARPQLLLAGVHRPAEARPEDRDDPARRQVAQVPVGPGRVDHRRLPALPPREDLRRRDRRGRGEAGQGTFAP